MPDEFPAILQKGEGVFTKGQMAAMGTPANNNVVQNFAAPNIVIQGNADDEAIDKINQILANHQKAIAAQARATQSQQRYNATGVM
jgi:hypothetical protein